MIRVNRCFWLGAIERGVPLLDRALVNPHERQLAERIFEMHLERHADERLGRIGFELERFVRIVPLLGLDWTIISMPFPALIFLTASRTLARAGFLLHPAKYFLRSAYAMYASAPWFNE